MAIDLSAVSGPWAFQRATLHATPGNLDVVALPPWAKTLTIRAAGEGAVKVSATGAQDAAVTEYCSIAPGDALTLRSVQISTYPLRLTGTVESDPVELILESAMGS